MLSKYVSVHIGKGFYFEVVVNFSWALLATRRGNLLLLTCQSIGLCTGLSTLPPEPIANYSSVCAPLADSVILQSKIWTCERQKGVESGDGVPLKRPTMI